MAATNGATEADLAKLSLNDARAQHSVDPSADALVAALSAAKRKDKPLIRSTAHTITSGGASSGGAGSDAVPAKEGEVMHVLHSWKTAEFAYRKSGNVGSELLTLARGLFTEQVADKHHRIAVRGYDKFFNIGEMAWTKVRHIPFLPTSCSL